jgi:hypothetical protein
MTHTRLKYSQLEIHATTSAAGFKKWSVELNDLLSGRRRLDIFYTKREAIAAADKISRRRRIPLARGRCRPSSARAAAKFAAYQKRQALIAQRAAKRGGQS